MPISEGAAASHTRGRFGDYGFFVALTLAALLFLRTLQAVVAPVLVGAFAAVLARPICLHMERKLHHHPRFAAALTTIGVVLLVVLPSGFMGWILIQEIVSAASSAARHLVDDGVAGVIAQLPISEKWRASIVPEELARLANELIAGAGRLVSIVFSAASSLFVGAFLFVVSLYYFLVDGPRWVAEIERLAPIEPLYVRAFAREFEAVSRALFFGTIVTAVVQGALAWLGYLLFGVPQPLLWGTITAFMSLTPVVGTAIVWLPIALLTALSGAPLRALGILAWGALVTGSIDNLIKPLLMKGKMRLHPLIVFLSIVGGVAAFSLVGIFIGPLAAALFLTALRIYDRDYRARLG